MAASTRPAADERLGSQVAERYTLDRFLARGGMGAVYAATDSKDGAIVAVKLLEDQSDGAIGRRRFFNEAALCASIDHPRVVQVLDFGSEPDRSCYMVMELLEGVTLHRYLNKKKRLPVEDALALISQLCDGLGAAHDKGFAHRDLKPGNVFVVGERAGVPEIKLLDFGLAKRTTDHVDLTLTGTFMGSPTYMSPEQVKGLPVGPGTDLYNAGLILWTLLVGKPLFRKEEVSATLIAHVTEPVPSIREQYPKLEIPAEVEWLLSTCLAKRPEDRFASAAELKAAIQGVLQRMNGESGAELPFQGRTLRGPLRQPATPGRKRMRRVLTAVGAMVLGMVLMLAAILLVVVGYMLGQG